MWIEELLKPGAHTQIFSKSWHRVEPRIPVQTHGLPKSVWPVCTKGMHYPLHPCKTSKICPESTASPSLTMASFLSKSTHLDNLRFCPPFVLLNSPRSNQQVMSVILCVLSHMISFLSDWCHPLLYSSQVVLQPDHSLSSRVPGQESSPFQSTCM